MATVTQLQRTSPEAVGIPSTVVLDFIEAVERDTGIIVLDSIAVTLWGTLRAAGVPPSGVEGWGRLFREVA